MSPAVIVADASVIVESLLNSRPRARTTRQRLAAAEVHSPHLVDIEVLAALRRLAASDRISSREAQSAAQELARMPINRHPHTPFLQRVWELRESVSAYDAIYVAMAERAGATLLTLDRRLAAAHGPRCKIELPQV